MLILMLRSCHWAVQLTHMAGMGLFLNNQHSKVKMVQEGELHSGVVWKVRPCEENRMHKGEVWKVNHWLRSQCVSIETRKAN